jgi:hypothetical protein
MAALRRVHSCVELHAHFVHAQNFRCTLRMTTKDKRWSNATHERVTNTGAHLAHDNTCSFSLAKTVFSARGRTLPICDLIINCIEPLKLFIFVECSDVWINCTIHYLLQCIYNSTVVVDTFYEPAWHRSLVIDYRESKVALQFCAFPEMGTSPGLLIEINLFFMYNDE